LDHIKVQHAGDKLKVHRAPSFDFNVHDMKAYNAAYNYLIEKAAGDTIFFLHPDMIVTDAEKIVEMRSGPLAWWTHITSFAGDFNTQIVKGRAKRWKNIHGKKFGLHYFGGYGSVNEDFYHRDITGKAYDHHGENFAAYPFEVTDSGLHINHYCELKSYRRRFEKMKACLKTQHPGFADNYIEELAAVHPRVTLEATTDKFGTFEMQQTDAPIPAVFEKHKSEFNKVLGRAA
jgi:hypothetical protein